MYERLQRGLFSSNSKILFTIVLNCYIFLEIAGSDTSALRGTVNHFSLHLTFSQSGFNRTVSRTFKIHQNKDQHLDLNEHLLYLPGLSSWNVKWFCWTPGKAFPFLCLTLVFYCEEWTLLTLNSKQRPYMNVLWRTWSWGCGSWRFWISSFYPFCFYVQCIKNI